MTRILVSTLFLATPAMAHDGVHHHPHGVEQAWHDLTLLGGFAAAVLVFAFGILQR